MRLPSVARRSRATAALLLALVSLGTVTMDHAAAQNPQAPAASHTLSAVLGIAVDSIHGGPLVGATVRVSGTEREGVTDNKGYYRIDSIPPGVRRVSLHHPLLDTLGMDIGTRPIDFPAGEVPVVPLGTPSPMSMLQIACPSAPKTDGESGLLGVVRDPDTGKPAIGAQISLNWTEVSVSKIEGIRRARRSRNTVVDSAGNYAICGLPDDLGATLQATLGDAATAYVAIAVPANHLLALRSLSLGAAQMVTDTVDGSVRKHRRGPATVRGRVVGPDSATISGARVEVLGTLEWAFTATNGTFSIPNAPAGTQAVAVRGVGYSPSVTIVELSAKTPREVTVTLNSVQVLPTVQAEVSATAGLDRVGFTERKRTGFGRFITREDIEKRNPIQLTDMLSTMPGVRASTDANGNDILTSTRNSPGDQGCTAVYVDHMMLRPPLPGQLISHLNFMVRPEQVAAIEAYQPFDVPGEFTQGGDRCLTFVIWTKFGVGDQRTGPSP